MQQTGTKLALVRSYFAVTAAGLLLLLPALLSRQADAAVSYVQSNAAIATSASLTTTASAGNLLVAICGTNTGSNITGPSGFTQIINENGTVSQGMFYKISNGTEKTVGCTFTGTGTEGVQILEYSGIHAYNTLESSSSASGTGTSVSTGTITTTHANDLLVSGAIDNSQTAISWTSPFTTRDGAQKTNGGQSSRDAVSSGDQIVTSATGYSAIASAGNAAWRGQIAAFRALSSTPTLVADIVDASGNTVTSPSTTLSSVTTAFTCQTASGTLGTSTQKIRVSNATDNPGWVLTIAPTSGPSTTWYAPPVGPIPAHTYSFNNASGSGCTNGQMTVSAAASTVAAQTNCSPTGGIAKGGSAAFSNGATNAVTLLSASSPADIDCYWDMTGVSITQKVPPGQPSGNYSLNMTLTIVAN